MMDYADDSLVEKLWKDLNGQVSRQQIIGAVREIGTGFQDARVTTFVPIFIHRRALQQLRLTHASPDRSAASSTPADDE